MHHFNCINYSYLNNNYPEQHFNAAINSVRDSRRVSSRNNISEQPLFGLIIMHSLVRIKMKLYLVFLCFYMNYICKCVTIQTENRDIQNSRVSMIEYFFSFLRKTKWIKNIKLKSVWMKLFLIFFFQRDFLTSYLAIDQRYKAVVANVECQIGGSVCSAAPI